MTANVQIIGERRMSQQAKPIHTAPQLSHLPSVSMHVIRALEQTVRRKHSIVGDWQVFDHVSANQQFICTYITSGEIIPQKEGYLEATCTQDHVLKTLNYEKTIHQSCSENSCHV